MIQRDGNQCTVTHVSVISVMLIFLRLMNLDHDLPFCGLIIYSRATSLCSVAKHRSNMGQALSVKLYIVKVKMCHLALLMYRGRHGIIGNGFLVTTNFFMPVS